MNAKKFRLFFYIFLKNLLCSNIFFLEYKSYFSLCIEIHHYFLLPLGQSPKILGMSHESLKPVSFSALFHELFLTFLTAIMNLYLTACSFFQTFLCVSSLFHPSYCFFLLFSEDDLSSFIIHFRVILGSRP